MRHAWAIVLVLRANDALVAAPGATPRICSSMRWTAARWMKSAVEMVWLVLFMDGFSCPLREA
ncbi:hypothetical protein ELH51_05420 [Rhizobium ruizarguesonis]|nr:hypothetical protein ELI45_10730 [Rhizobium ruizarguesonis]TBB21264.1 hypothetical protein ELH51_05420 [Rhizobium ruizarguesonis]